MGESDNDDQARPRLVNDDLVSDASLVDAALDGLNHAGVAAVIGDLVRNVDAPANVAMFGPWGSGKSSVYGMIEADLAAHAPEVAVVRYDAWKFGGHQLQRNFLMEIAATFNVEHDKYLTSGIETVRLDLPALIGNNKKSLALEVGLALLVAVIACVVTAEAALWAGTADRSEEYAKALPSAWVVFGLVAAGLLLSNQTLAAGAETHSRSPMQDADQFSAAFHKLVRKVLDKKVTGSSENRRLIVLIDELDRCRPSDVVATLEQLKTFLDHEHCVFVVAADREVLEAAVAASPQAKPLRGSEPYYSTAGAYLDKIFKHQLTLPPVRTEALTSFAVDIAREQSGLWAELQEHDERTFEDVVYSLVPAHVRSPRRVKILMNTFVTNCRIIDARMLEWRKRAAEVAVLTVLQVEFPDVVADLLDQPRLLEAITGQITDPSDELRELASRYRRDAPPTAQADIQKIASAAGPIFAEPETTDAEIQRARSRSNEYLVGYLGKIHAANMMLPRPDLVYLQTAAGAAGLEDVKLGELLDLATDLDPVVLEQQFSRASTVDRLAAIRFLIDRVNGNVLGPARANLIEAACRIVESFVDADELDQLELVARQAAATVMTEAPKGRWRARSTAGAIILTMLTYQRSQPNPFHELGEFATPAALADAGMFGRLQKLAIYVDGTIAADTIDEVYGQAYETIPGPMEQALAQLPPAAAQRLWAHEKSTIRRVLLEELPPASLGDDDFDAMTTGIAPEGDRSESDAAAEATPVETRTSRYISLLQAIVAREEAAPILCAEALMMGLESEDPALATVAWRLQVGILGQLDDEPALRNGVGTRGVAHAAKLDHTDDWLAVLDHSADADDDGVADALARLLSDLQGLPPENVEDVAEQVQAIAGWFSFEQVRDTAKALQGLLAELPYASPTDPADARRATFYAVLNVLVGTGLLPDERVQEIRRHDVVSKVHTAPLGSAVIEHMRGGIAQMDPTTAAAIDDELGRTSRIDAGVAVGRLRVAARAQASRTALKFKDLAPLDRDDAEFPTLVGEWLSSSVTPTLGEVLKAIAAKVPFDSALSRYARGRSASECSRLWIALRTADYGARDLQIVGRHGVDDKVTEHLRPDIFAARLAEQRMLIDELLTANHTGTAARKAITSLALALLEDGISGQGNHAARIVIAANGAAPGRKATLRTAFDEFTKARPSAIRPSLLKQLAKLELLTKRKKGPIAKAAGWLKN